MNINELCKDVPPEIRPEVRTLAKAVKVLKKKVETQMPIYNDLPLAQLLTTTQGEKALKANPAAQEYRATVREYAQALSNLQSIIDKYSAGKSDANSQLSMLRKKVGRFEIVSDHKDVRAQ